MNVSASKKYAIIQEMAGREGNLINIARLCEAAGVSRSGYYHYLKTEGHRQAREEADQRDFEQIKQAYQFRGYAKGARGIYMRLLHTQPPTPMNIKKIRRLMRKYRLVCPIRKANPHRRAYRITEEASTVANLVNREFTTHGPRAVLLTDITYIINAKAPRCYMVTILDACTKEVLSWAMHPTQEVDFVLSAVQQLLAAHDISPQAIIHSDQGVHYRSMKFIELVEQSELRRSMSRKANCWDNAPQESFFGHMKDEIDLSKCTTFDEILQIVADWVDYYNNDRYQWNLARLSPNAYYHYLTTGIYPLAIPQAKGAQ
jgi:transposase InsO family protein